MQEKTKRKRGIKKGERRYIYVTRTYCIQVNLLKLPSLVPVSRILTRHTILLYLKAAFCKWVGVTNKYEVPTARSRAKYRLKDLIHVRFF